MYVSKILRCICAAVFAFSTLLPATGADADTDMPLYALSPGGRRVFEAGMAAVEAKDWREAIARFRAAHALSPAYPPILYNLGLANFAAGRELPAMYWLQAYLATTPEDGVAARDRLRLLRSSVESKVRRILEETVRMDKEFDPIGRTLQIENIFAEYLRDARSASLSARDHSSSALDRIRGDVASGLAYAGELDLAQAFLAHILEPGNRDKARLAIAAELEARGEVQPATEVLAKVEDAETRVLKTFEALLATAATDQLNTLIAEASETSKDRMQYDLLRRLLNSGELNAARKVLSGMKPDGMRKFGFERLANYHLQRGDLSAARTAAERARVGEASLPVLLELMLGTSRKPAKPRMTGDWLSDFSAQTTYTLYYDRLIYFQTITGRFEEAKRSRDAAAREFSDEVEWDLWHSSYRDGDVPVVRAITARVEALLAEGNLAEAKLWLARHPRSACGPWPFHYAESPVAGAKSAYRLVTEFEIGLNRFADAVDTIAAMPPPSEPRQLDDDCTTERALALVRLARAQIEAGGISDAEASTRRAAALIWSGALNKPVIEAVGQLYEDLGSVDGAVWAHSNLALARLRDWIGHAQYVNDKFEPMDLSESVRTVHTAAMLAKAPEWTEGPVDKARLESWTVIEKLVEIAQTLGRDLQEFDHHSGRLDSAVQRYSIGSRPVYNEVAPGQ